MRSRSFALLTLLIALPPSAGAIEPEGSQRNPHLDRARDLYAAVQYEETELQLELALAQPDNSREQLSEIYALLGTVQVALDDRRGAVRSFECLLLLRPDHRFGPGESPKVLAALERARSGESPPPPGICLDEIPAPEASPEVESPVVERGAPESASPELASTEPASTEPTSTEPASTEPAAIEGEPQTIPRPDPGAAEGSAEEGHDDLLLSVGLGTAGIGAAASLLLGGMAAFNEAVVHDVDRSVDERRAARSTAELLWVGAVVGGVVIAAGGGVAAAGYWQVGD